MKRPRRVRLTLPDVTVGRYKGGLRFGVISWLRYRSSWRPERWDGSPGVRCAAFGPFYANQRRPR